ncbi:caspase, EACC1-associated type [Verrucosispora sp. WMMD703]|uniref:caspase, EACC1-associated type n=1 Tax=Verrucosispora sp. WMMD703 TaxID=3403463 RepID=UPI003B95301B
MRLPDRARSSLLLIGSAQYRSEHLPDLPGVANNVADLADALTGDAGGFDQRTCVQLLNPDSALTVQRALRRQVRSTEDTLLVYIAGHGWLGHRGELYLGLPDVDPEELRVTALAFDAVREALLDSTAANKVLIIDACYSGRALEGVMASEAPLGALTAIEGTYTLTATSGNRLAIAQPGSRHTAFTGELLRLLTDGVPGGPQLLTLDLLYQELVQAAKAKDFPQPEQVNRGTVRDLAIARNAAVEQTDGGVGEQFDDGAVELPAIAPRWIVPGFAGEHGLTRDMLGIKADSDAVAVLLASRSLKPPLAFGVYGKWGSGKTFFMRTLEREVKALADDELPGLCRKVESVWFNAWHYAEGNLWASLIHRIFSSLHGDGPAAEKRLDAAMSKITAVTEAKAEAQAKVQAAQATADVAADRLQQIKIDYQEARNKAKQATLKDSWKAFTLDTEVRGQFDEARQTLGLQKAGDSARELADAAAEVRQLAGRGWALATAGRWWQTPLFLGLVAAALVGAAGLGIAALLDGRTTWLSPVILRISELGALAAGGAAWLRRQTDLARRLLRPAEAVQRLVDERVAALDREHQSKCEAAERELREIEDQRDGALAQLAEAQARVAEATAELDQLHGPRLLEHYLAERVNSADYRQYLGVVAQAHRDLEDLNSYFTTALDSAGDAKPVDRIILYIDDLDRCSPTMVVRVLEAVHLLLALPLFVVVVGVDARWLIRSLREEHSVLLESGEDASTATTATDYLDKIFQLGYGLPDMTVDRCAALLINAAVASQTTGPDQPAAERAAADAAEPSRAAPGAARSDSTGRPAVSRPADMQLAAVNALVLDDPELALLAAVAPLVGTSPRRTKRFLNVYRVIRARTMMDESHSRLLAEPGASAQLITVVALALGLPNRMPVALDLIAADDPTTVSAFLSAQQVPPSEARLIRGFLEVGGELQELPVGVLTRWLPLVRPFAWPFGNTLTY